MNESRRLSTKRPHHLDYGQAVSPRSRIAQEREQVKVMKQIQQEVAHTWRRLTKKEIARQYPAKRLERLSQQAQYVSSLDALEETW